MSVPIINKAREFELHPVVELPRHFHSNEPVRKMQNEAMQNARGEETETDNLQIGFLVCTGIAGFIGIVKVFLIVFSVASNPLSIAVIIAIALFCIGLLCLMARHDERKSNGLESDTGIVFLKGLGVAVLSPIFMLPLALSILFHVDCISCFFLCGRSSKENK